MYIPDCNLTIPNFFPVPLRKIPSIRGINVIIPGVTADSTSFFDSPSIRGECGSSQIYLLFSICPSSAAAAN